MRDDWKLQISKDFISSYDFLARFAFSSNIPVHDLLNTTSSKARKSPNEDQTRLIAEQ